MRKKEIERKMKEEKDAATKIQAGFRGWKSRKQVSVKRREPPGKFVSLSLYLFMKNSTRPAGRF